MKHGPIALIDEAVPVVVVAPTDSIFVPRITITWFASTLPVSTSMNLPARIAVTVSGGTLEAARGAAGDWANAPDAAATLSERQSRGNHTFIDTYPLRWR